MIPHPPYRPCKEQQADLFALSLLLAEGQVGAASDRWAAFIDQLAEITDAFAAARAGSASDKASDRACASA